MQTNALSLSDPIITTKDDKPHKKSVVKRILDRWEKRHKSVDGGDQSHNTLKRSITIAKASKRRMPVKIIFLGIESSGKSTVAKQMKIMYEGGFTQEERRIMLLEMQSYILGNIKDILQGVEKLNLTLPPETQKLAAHVSSLPKSHSWTPELVETLKVILHDSVVLKFMLKCDELQLYDNFSSLLTKLYTFVSPNYIPTNEEILKYHTRTTGVIEYSFKLSELEYRVQDLGGCKSEQRKWIFFFENVSAVIFVVAINEYDLQLREDNNVNRMHEALRLFSLLGSNSYFKHTPIILLLNKTDLFRQKLEHRSLSVCFPEYTGGRDYNIALNFIEEKFRSHTEHKVTIYTTSAIGEMQDIFADVMLNAIAI